MKSTTPASAPTEPSENPKGIRLPEELDLRDYFAAHALAGLAGSWVKENHEIIAQVAHDAYQIADAMLKARKAGR